MLLASSDAGQPLKLAPERCPRTGHLCVHDNSRHHWPTPQCEIRQSEEWLLGWYLCRAGNVHDVQQPHRDQQHWGGRASIIDAAHIRVARLGAEGGAAPLTSRHGPLTAPSGCPRLSGGIRFGKRLVDTVLRVRPAIGTRRLLVVALDLAARLAAGAASKSKIRAR